MSVDLKYCPFCGGDAERIEFGLGAGDNEGGSCVACTECGSSGPVEFGFKENFVSTWNTRAPQWQPIESAPEEVPADEAVIVCVTHDEPRFAEQRMVGEAYKVDGVWWWAGSSPNDYHTDPIEDMYGLGCVTHWQPLPAPPEVQP